MRCILCHLNESDCLGGELTGDTESPDGPIMRDNDIIVTTPEKWDAVTRRMKDYTRLIDMVRLLLVQPPSPTSLIMRSMKFTC